MRRRGSILILVMFVMVVLSLLCVSFGYRTALETRLARQHTIAVQLRAHATSLAGVALARLAENTNDFDHPSEPWHQLLTVNADGWPEDQPPQERAAAIGIVGRCQVIDEESKLKLTFASQKALQQLGMSPMQANSLLDWMDKDDSSLPDGAERDFYLSKGYAYIPKNAPLEVLEEMLLVRGITQRDYEPAFFSEALQLQPTDWAPRRHGWAELLTCVGDGRIDLNTAEVEVLRTLPLSPGAAEQIAAFTHFDANSGGVVTGHVFTSDADIDQLQGVSAADKAVLKSLGTFKSSYFRIFVVSTHAQTQLRCTLQVLIHLKKDGPEILQWQMQP